MIGLAIALSISPLVGAFALAIGITKDGSPFRRSFWTA